jgi:hypothetical protein
MVVPGISFPAASAAARRGRDLRPLQPDRAPLALLLSLPAPDRHPGPLLLRLNGILLWVASFFLPGYNVAGVSGHRGEPGLRDRELGAARAVRAED